MQALPHQQAVLAATPAPTPTPANERVDTGAVTRALMKLAAERLMKIDVEVLCGARYGARLPQRLNSRNGFRTRLWSTRCGTINVAIPKLRRGSYFPDWLFRPFGTSLLLAFVTDCLSNGVSVRKTGVLVRVLGLSDIPDTEITALAAALGEIVGTAAAG